MSNESEVSPDNPNPTTAREAIIEAVKHEPDWNTAKSSRDNNGGPASVLCSCGVTILPTWQAVYEHRADAVLAVVSSPPEPTNDDDPLRLAFIHVLFGGDEGRDTGMPDAWNDEDSIGIMADELMQAVQKFSVLSSVEATTTTDEEARQEVAENAWDEGVDAMYECVILRMNADDVKRRNPYRAGVGRGV